MNRCPRRAGTVLPLLLVSLLMLLGGCASHARRVCDGPLRPINPPQPANASHER